jgi:hypothetical protein
VKADRAALYAVIATYPNRSLELPRQVRELLFVVLAGSPGRRRCGAWRGLAAARGDDDAADDLQTHAAAMAARDPCLRRNVWQATVVA